MQIPSTPRRRARLEIVPLIDIIFFLLATFVMVSLSMVQNQGITVRLPQAATGAPQAPALMVTVTVTEAGQVYLNKDQVNLDELTARLAALHRDHPEMRVAFNGDGLAYFGDVIKVLDAARALGIERVAIQTTGAQGG